MYHVNQIIQLKNSIQEYDWGSKKFIPDLMGKLSPAKRPQAELWMGAHPKAPSQVKCNGELISLIDLIRKDPDGILGQSVAKQFSNRLPFLFKILAASRPLSIQAHPNLAQATEGFALENRMIPVESPDRNYRDDNHKPELICALTPFTMLKGFREVSEIIGLMEKVAFHVRELGIDLLKKSPSQEGLKRYFLNLMTMNKSKKCMPKS